MRPSAPRSFRVQNGQSTMRSGRPNVLASGQRGNASYAERAGGRSGYRPRTGRFYRSPENTGGRRFRANTQGQKRRRGHDSGDDGWAKRRRPVEKRTVGSYAAHPRPRFVTVTTQVCTSKSWRAVVERHGAPHSEAPCVSCRRLAPSFSLQEKLRAMKFLWEDKACWEQMEHLTMPFPARRFLCCAFGCSDDPLRPMHDTHEDEFGDVRSESGRGLSEEEWMLRASESLAREVGEEQRKLNDWRAKLGAHIARAGGRQRERNDKYEALAS